MSTPPDLIHALSDRYLIQRELGRGGMATVYLARDPRHHRAVALKVFHRELAAVLGPERFLREIRIAAQLNHPHILPLFDSGESAGHLWYVMPLIEGGSLQARLDRERQLPLNEALKIAREVAGALGCAHGRGIVHRDLKPANVLMGGGHALVADFGIAQILSPEGEKLTQTGMVIGTAGYMSPEQASGDGVVDARSDWYALGCLLYEMLAGEPLWAGPTAQAILARQLTEPVPSVRRLRESVPPAVEGAMLRLLATSPADRFETAAQVLDALALDTTTGSRFAMPTAGGSRRVSSRVTVAAVAAVGVLATGWLVARGSGAGNTSRRPATVDHRAAEAYAEGRKQLERRTQAGMVRAVGLFREAIGRDSSYGLAWAGLASAMQWASGFGLTVPGVPAESLFAREMEAADRAIALDSSNVSMWVLRAEVSVAIDPTSRAPALRALRRALVLAPNDPTVLARFGWTLEDVGDREGADSFMRRSVALGANPVALATHYYWWRQFDSAAVWADSAVIMDATRPWIHETVGAIALARGRLGAAEAAYQAARRLDTGPTAVRSLEGLAQVAARRGDVDQAMRFIREAEGLTDSVAPTDHAAVSLGSAYAAIGRLNRALDWLERYQPRAALHFQLHLRRDLQLDPLRGTARFRALLTGPT